MHLRSLFRFTVATLAITFLAAPAFAYIHFPPTTLPKLCEQSRAIRVLTVKKHDKEKGVIIFETAETLKGKSPEGTIFKHVIGKEDKGSKPIFDWVADGKQALMFTIETGPIGIACGYVFIDKYCYSVACNGSGEFWLMFRTEPEMAATHYGPVEKLRQVTKDVLAGKDVKAPVDESLKPLTNEERRKRAQALNDIMTKNREK